MYELVMLDVSLSRERCFIIIVAPDSCSPLRLLALSNYDLHRNRPIYINVHQ